MKVTLKDYQDDAVREVLEELRKARKRWREDKDRQAISLTAPTGAGKTVMAAAVFEALFHGDDSHDFDSDTGAVVIWLSDDPSLNEQTRFRLIACADRLRSTDMIVVNNSFHQPRFEPGKIYFLNTQKLSRKSLLVRGFDDSGDPDAFPEMRADTRAHTIWDTIRNTIEDPSLTLYLVLDEAHRGMGGTSRAAEVEKTTLVKRLINGEKGVPGIPIVLGISATVERFTQAMEGAKGRTMLPGVQVDSTRVQDSGLLKDTVVVDVPDEEGQFDTVLLRRATGKLKESTTEWARYGREQESGEIVSPLMVLQVPNTPNHGELGHWLDTIFEAWKDIPEDCVAHVFGDHTTKSFGRHTVQYISPERVQDATWVRVLLAKDAISTGWDCPRAEVMVSFRRAVDRTHITQLLGRMVRTPLARRIPGNDRLNSVDCLLPFFDEETVRSVVDALMQGGGDVPPLGRVLLNPVEMKPNPAVSGAVWEAFRSLPSETRPQHGAKPPKRLTALAHELAMDGLLPGAGQKAHAAMHKSLDAFVAKFSYEFRAKRDSVLTVEGRTIILRVREGETLSRSFQTEGDATVIGDAYRRTARIISPDIARTYAEHRARRKPEMDGDLEDALIEAREDIGALGLMQNLDVFIDGESTKLADQWLKEYRGKIKLLPDDRQEAYREIRAMSREPQDVDLAQPVSRWEATAVREKDGRETKLPLYEHHILCDEGGAYPADLNEWEKAVLKSEMKREGFSCWYRNPGRPTQDSLGVAYMKEDDTKILRPDFLFFAKDSKGKIVTDIVDPHSIDWGDALAKLQGLARYAATHADGLRRIEAVAQAKGRLRVLDLTRVDVRKAVNDAREAGALYEGLLARDYPNETSSRKP
jgi:type III restriction enzyme